MVGRTSCGPDGPRPWDTAARTFRCSTPSEHGPAGGSEPGGAPRGGRRPEHRRGLVEGAGTVLVDPADVVQHAGETPPANSDPRASTDIDSSASCRCACRWPRPGRRRARSARWRSRGGRTPRSRADHRRRSAGPTGPRRNRGRAPTRSRSGRSGARRGRPRGATRELVDAAVTGPHRRHQVDVAAVAPQLPVGGGVDGHELVDGQLAGRAHALGRLLARYRT